MEDGKIRKTRSPRIDYIWLCLRVIYIVFGAIGFICALAALMGCKFISYEPSDPPNNKNDTRPSEFIDLDYVEIGLFKYNRDQDGCRDISDDFDDLTWQWTMAQTCGCLAVIFSAAALVFLLVDLILCRFPCSRILIGFLFLAAFITECLVSLVYLARICDPNYADGPYTCRPQTGTWLSVVAIVFFLVCTFLACCIPKPTPVAVMVRNGINNDKVDGWCACLCCDKKEEDEEGKKGWCACCCRRKEEIEEIEEEEEMEPLTPEVREIRIVPPSMTSLVFTHSYRVFRLLSCTGKRGAHQ